MQLCLVILHKVTELLEGHFLLRNFHFHHAFNNEYHFYCQTYFLNVAVHCRLSKNLIRNQSLWIGIIIWNHNFSKSSWLTSWVNEYYSSFYLKFQIYCSGLYLSGYDASNKSFRSYFTKYSEIFFNGMIVIEAISSIEIRKKMVIWIVFTSVFFKGQTLISFG